MRPTVISMVSTMLSKLASTTCSRLSASSSRYSKLTFLMALSVSCLAAWLIHIVPATKIIRMIVAPMIDIVRIGFLLLSILLILLQRAADKGFKCIEEHIRLYRLGQVGVQSRLHAALDVFVKRVSGQCYDRDGLCVRPP